MMRSVLVTRFHRTAFKDYRITIEKSKRRRAIAQPKR
jgi:hypothetical protein